ncbi:MAG: DNA-directed RNA polymerase subunit H [Nanoarchaeota archaeon]|nr:DNA-directed RNA polymerase subunit H [Nanoarchaeota archaeon]
MVTKKSKKEEKPIDIFKSRLVPECRVLSEDEEKKLLEQYNISKRQLPLIFSTDPVVKALGAKVGNVIEFTRKSKTAGLSKYYRVVVGGIRG